MARPKATGVALRASLIWFSTVSSRTRAPVRPSSRASATDSARVPNSWTSSPTSSGRPTTRTRARDAPSAAATSPQSGPGPRAGDGTASQVSTSAARRSSSRSASVRRSSPATPASTVQPPRIARAVAASSLAVVSAATARRPGRRGERQVMRGASRTSSGSRRCSRESACGVSRPTRSSTSTASPQAVGCAAPDTIRHRPPARPTRAALVHALPTSRSRVSSVSGVTRTGVGAGLGLAAAAVGDVEVAWSTEVIGSRASLGDGGGAWSSLRS